MHSIVLNFSGSGLSQKTEALALKAGYLLGNTIITAGSARRDMFAKEFLSDLAPLSEIKLLINLYKKQPEIHKEFVHMQVLMKQGEKIKHKKTDLLVASKTAEKMVHQCWISALDDYEKMMDSFGFKQLKELTEEGTFGFIEFNEDPEDGSDSKIRVSELLQRLLLSEDEEPKDEDNEPEIFFLGNEFLSADYEKPEIYNAFHQQASAFDSTYLQHCFTLPDINRLSTGELQSVRRQLQFAGSSFRQHTDDWIDMCYFGDDVSKRVSFFTKQVLASAIDLQQIIDSNDILKLCSRHQNNDVKTEVWMGEMPVWQLWEFYKHYEAINNITWNKLQKVKNDKVFKDQRWPVMMLNLPDEEYLQDKIKKDNLYTKKYLMTD